MTSAQVIGTSAEVSRARSRYLCENSLPAENEIPFVYLGEAADSSLRWSLLDFRTLLSPDYKLLAWSKCDPARSWGLICARQFAWLENLSWVDGLGKISLSLFLISSLIVSLKFNSASTALRHHITLCWRSGIIARFSSCLEAQFLLLPVSFLPLVRPRSWSSVFSHYS